MIVKGLAQFYIWYPMELRVVPGSSSFSLNGIKYFICVFASSDAVLTLSLGNTIHRVPASTPQGHKYALTRDITSLGHNQFVNFQEEDGNINANLLMDTNDSGSNLSKSAKYTQVKLFFEFEGTTRINAVLSHLALTALDHFLRIYRFTSLDTSVKESQSLQPFQPFMVQNFVTYSEEDQNLSDEEKIEKYCNLVVEGAECTPVIAKNLVDADLQNLDRAKISGEIAYHLTSGEFSEWKVMITRAYELGNEYGKFNAAILECFIAFEAEMRDLARLLKYKIIVKIKGKNKNKQLGIVDLIDGVIPKITKESEILNILHEVRKTRNRIVHKNTRATEEDFSNAISTINRVFEMIENHKKDLQQTS